MLKLRCAVGWGAVGRDVLQWVHDPKGVSHVLILQQRCACALALPTDFMVRAANQ